MKARHWVTLIVFLVAGAALAGIFLRLAAGDEDEPSSTGDAATDSVRDAVQSTAAATAFATEIALPVAGAPAQRGTFVIWVQATGRAAAIRQAALHAEVAGPVVQVPVREGGSVRAGQLIARIDSALFELNRRKAEAQLARAQADYRDRTLFDDRIEDPAVREERARQARIRAGLDEMEATLAEAEYELAKTRIGAPFSGRVANLAVAPGSRVSPGDSVATVIDLSQVEIDAEVLHSELPYVEVGREAIVTFPAIPGQRFTGRVATVNPLIDPETQTARVTVRLANPESKIVPGMPGQVRIAGRLLADRTFVPKEAIVERNRRQVVFVFEASEPGSAVGSAQWKYVTTGLETDRFVEIIPNPSENHYVPSGGEIVLVDGHATLIHDARVRVENYEEIAPGADGRAREPGSNGGER